MNLNDLLQQCGGVVTTAELNAAGFSKRAINSALDEGLLRRLRIGVYQSTDMLPDDIGVARALGASLTCVTALRHHGIWTPQGDGRRHFRLTRAAASQWPNNLIRKKLAPLDVPHVLPSPWRDKVVGDRDPISLALLSASKCLAQDELAAALDSTVRKGIPSDKLQSLAEFGDAKLRNALTCLDPESDSGLETLVRIRLRSLRLRVRSQVDCEGWTCDFVVGDWLVIEVDGLEFHRTRDRIDRDHWKDRQLTMAGYTVFRFTNTDIIHRWHHCEEQILNAVRAGWHRRPRTGAA